MSNQADSINLHGNVTDATVEDTYFQDSGDDIFALWGATSNPSNVTFRNGIGVNPGILRPNWYGNCVATYGLKSVLFENITCRAPTLDNPILSPHDGSITIDTTMFMFFASFGADYPEGNSVEIKGYNFADLQGNAYTADAGTSGPPVVGKMVWTQTDEGGIAAPYYLVSSKQKVNVHVTPAGAKARAESSVQQIGEKSVIV